MHNHLFSFQWLKSKSPFFSNRKNIDGNIFVTYLMLALKKQMTPFPHNNFKRREKWMITLAKEGLDW